VSGLVRGYKNKKNKKFLKNEKIHFACCKPMLFFLRTFYTHVSGLIVTTFYYNLLQFTAKCFVTANFFRNFQIWQ